MSELEEKVDRIAEMVALTWKLAKAVMRGHNKNTKVFNDNFDVFDDKVNRNADNIDKIVKTLQGLVGDAAEYDKEHPEGKIMNKDIELMFL